jgi:HSP20 family protein
LFQDKSGKENNETNKERKSQVQPNLPIHNKKPNKKEKSSNMCYNQAYGYSHRYRGYRGRWNAPYHRYRSVPVNIEEREDSYVLTLYAPTLVKENIRLTTKNDVLTVSYTAPQDASGENQNFTRREYYIDSFERSFILNGKVEVAGIFATYTEGILTITLPKNPLTNQPAQEVTIT